MRWVTRFECTLRTNHVCPFIQFEEIECWVRVVMSAGRGGLDHPVDRVGFFRNSFWVLGHQSGGRRFMCMHERALELMGATRGARKKVASCSVKNEFCMKLY